MTSRRGQVRGARAGEGEWEGGGARGRMVGATVPFGVNRDGLEPDKAIIRVLFSLFNSKAT